MMILNLFNMKIRTKLVLITLLLLIVPSTLIGFISYYTAEDSLNELGATTIQNTVYMTIEYIDAVNQEVERGTLSLEEAQEQVKVFILGEMQEDGTRPINEHIDLGENGYIFIYDETGTLVAHPNIEGTNLWDTADVDGHYFTQDIIQSSQAGGGFTNYQWGLPNDPDTVAPKIMYNLPDPNWGWIVVGGSYVQDFNADANRILKTIIIVLSISVLIGAVIIYLFSKHISDPLLKVSHQINEIANGNLAVDDTNITQKDEIGELSANVNRMTSELKDMIGKVSDTAEQVAASSEQLTASAEETSKATEQITESIQSVASGAEEQVNSATKAEMSASDISKGMERITDRMESVTNASTVTKEKSESGQNTIQQTIDQMTFINDKTDIIAQVVNQLGNKSTEIGNIVSLITNVAEQTNLLALNAAIEAARAGEHGKGFAVVADEVRKLAEQSSQSAHQINQLIQDIQIDIKRSVTSMDEGKSAVQDGITFVNQAGNEFEEISRSINEVTSQIEEVSTAVEQITAGTHSMVSAIKDSSKIAEDSAASSQNVAASAQEQNASMEEITAAATTLSNMAEELQESVKKFKL